MRRQKQLTQAEWVEFGNALKRIEGDLSKVAEFSGRVSGAVAFDRVWKIRRRVWGLRDALRLEGMLVRQFPDWPDALRVFYGEPMSQDGDDRR
jgi:hypothetical protein